MARDPQVVYDMNIMALKIAEHPEVSFQLLYLMMDTLLLTKREMYKLLKDSKEVQDLLVNVQQNTFCS